MPTTVDCWEYHALVLVPDVPARERWDLETGNSKAYVKPQYYKPCKVCKKDIRQASHKNTSGLCFDCLQDRRNEPKPEESLSSWKCNWAWRG